MQKIIENKGNIWAYYADLLFDNSKKCMDKYYLFKNGPEVEVSPEDLGPETLLRAVAYVECSNLAQKIVNNIMSENNKAKDLKYYFKPQKNQVVDILDQSMMYLMILNKSMSNLIREYLTTININCASLLH